MAEISNADVDLSRRNPVKHGCNDSSRMGATDQMMDGGILKRILSIPFHEIPVKFRLNLQVSQILFFHVTVNVRVAFAVQYKMTDKSV